MPLLSTVLPAACAVHQGPLAGCGLADGETAGPQSMNDLLFLGSPGIVVIDDQRYGHLP